MNWIYFYQQEKVELKFTEIIGPIENAMRELGSDYEAKMHHFLDEARKSLNDRRNPRSQPPVVTKLAHTALNVAKECYKQGFSPNAAKLSNIAGELFIYLKDGSQDQYIGQSLALFAKAANSVDQPISFDYERKRIQNVLTFRKTQLSAESSALVRTALLDVFTGILLQYQNQDAGDKIRQFLDDNYQAVCNPAGLTANEQNPFAAMKKIWEDAACHYAPDLHMVVSDQIKVASMTTAEIQKLLSPDQIKELRKGIQSINVQSCYNILKPIEPALKKEILEYVRVQNEVLMPPAVIDTSSQIQQQFEIAMKQNKQGNFSGAIETLDAALEINPGNYRMQEWVGAIYLRNGNLLQAKRRLESIPDTWVSLSRSWNLAYIYKSQGEKPKAFDILEDQFKRRKTRSVVYGIIELALDLKKTSCLVKTLSYLPNWEACALGFLNAQDSQASSSDVENYLVILDTLLSNTPLKIPSLSDKLTSNELSALADGFTKRSLVEAGLFYFEERLHRTVGETNKQIIYNSLGKLYHEKAAHTDAINNYILDFQIWETEKDVPAAAKRDRLIWMLDYCVTYQLADQGNLLLQRASDYRINFDKISEYEGKFKNIKPLRSGQEPEPVINRIMEKADPKPGLLDVKGTKTEPDAAPGNHAADYQVLLDAQEPLRKVNTVQMLVDHSELVKGYCSALKNIFGSDAGVLLELIDRFLVQCQGYLRKTNYEASCSAAQELLQTHDDFVKMVSRINNDKLLAQLVSIKRPFRHAAFEAAKFTDKLPRLDVRILNHFLPDADLQTSLLVELVNKCEFNITRVDLGLRSVTGGYEILGQDHVKLDQGIPAQSSRLVSFMVIRRKGTRHECFALEVVYSSRSIDNIPCDEIPEASIPIRDFKSVIGKERLENPYITLGAIPPENPENFHGREELVQEILNSFSGGESRQAPFLSGIRRVGKTSVLLHLLGNPPQGMIPVLIRVDTISPRTTGEFLYRVARLIYVQLAPEHIQVLGYAFNSELENQFLTNPSLAFSDFLDRTNKTLGNKRLLLMFDEVQVITEAIRNSRADPKLPRIDIEALDITRGHIEERSFSAILTGSLLFEEIRDQVENYDRLWGSVRGQDVPFLARDAVQKVLRQPAQSQGIIYPDAVIDRVWQYTQGYPVFVQLLGTEVITSLNNEQRVIVSIEDIDAASKRVIIGQDHLFKSWWDVRRLIRPIDEPIFETILEKQPSPGTGLPINLLVEEAAKISGAPESINLRLGKLLRLNILGRNENQDYRVKALLLEHWLKDKRSENNNRLPWKDSKRLNDSIVGIFVDHENVFVGLDKMQEQRPDDLELMKKTKVEFIAKKLWDRAGTYGEVDEHVAIADWHQPRKVGPEQHQRIYIRYFWDTRLPKFTGPQQADHELRDTVHEAFHAKPDINTYILVTGDSDLSELATFLIKEKKRVIIWSLKNSIARYYRQLEDWDKLEVVEIENILELNQGSRGTVG